MTPQASQLLRVERQLETRHATIREDCNVEVRDLLIGQEEKPVIACRQTRSVLGSPELESIETLTRKNHDAEPEMRVIVFRAELSNSVSEGTAEVAHVKHGATLSAARRRADHPQGVKRQLEPGVIVRYGIGQLIGMR